MGSFKILAMAFAVMTFAHQAFATQETTIAFYADLEGGACRSAHDKTCTGNGVPPQPFHLKLMGDDDELVGRKRFTYQVNDFTCVAELIAEKSGPYYTFQVVMSDSVSDEIKAEHFTFVTKVRNVSPMMLRTYAEVEGRWYQCLFKWAGKPPAFRE